LVIEEGKLRRTCRVLGRGVEHGQAELRWGAAERRYGYASGHHWAMPVTATTYRSASEYFQGPGRHSGKQPNRGAVRH
jgi:hypothetical protein